MGSETGSLPGNPVDLAGLALAKERCKLDIRKYAFSQRTINEWNRLPGECVNAGQFHVAEQNNTKIKTCWNGLKIAHTVQK